MTAAVGIVHLGLGAFHRAHQAVYLQRYKQRTGDMAWGLCSASLRSNHGLVDALRQADCRYHVAEYADRDTVELRHIDVMQQAVFTGRDDRGNWGRDLEQLLQCLCADTVRIVTLTVTEKGYYLSPASGELLLEAPEIMADMTHPQSPRTALGIIVEALARRRDAGKPPFTVLSCDNMPHNGQRLRRAVIALAACRDGGLSAWIETEVAFPSSMVDRIAPAMTAVDFVRLEQRGVDDPCAVACEAFSQWVIEDNFPQGRPDWEPDGVEMVADVTPFETMKLRMLNGSHSLLAYVGMLDGIETVADAVNRPELAALVRRYMHDEVAPTLAMPVGVDLAAYAEQLMARFANDSLRHRLQQVGMDGSQKLPQRWLPVALERLAQGGDVRCTILGLAAWMQYTSGRNLQGEPHSVDDPMAQHWVLLHADHGGDSAGLVAAFFAEDSVFPPALATRTTYTAAVAAVYDSLQTQGLSATLQQLQQLVA